MTVETEVGRGELPPVAPTGESAPPWWTRNRATIEAWAFMTPATVLVMVFFFIPIVLITYMSFLDIKGSNFVDNPGIWSPSNLSLDQYSRLWNDRFVPKILGNTVVYVLVTLAVFNVGMALAIALLTTHISRRAGFFFRVVWLLPRITPVVIYVLMWKRIGGPDPFGILHQIIPFGDETKNLVFSTACVFGDPLGWLCNDAIPLSGFLTSSWFFVFVVNGYVGASFGMIIFSSAIESIPKHFIMAAQVDGASTLQRIRYVTIPMLKWPLLFVTTFQALSLLASYVEILLLTNGGPGLYHTETWALTSYKRAFASYFGSAEYSFAAAWAVLLVIIGIAVSIVLLWRFRFDEMVEEPKIDAI